MRDHRSVIRNTATGADYEGDAAGVTQDVNVYVDDDVQVPGFVAVSDTVGEDAARFTADCQAPGTTARWG